MDTLDLFMGDLARLLASYLIARRLLRSARAQRLRLAGWLGWAWLLPEALLVAGLGYLAWGRWSFWPGPLLLAGGYLLSAGAAHALARRWGEQRRWVLGEVSLQVLGLLLLGSLAAPGNLWLVLGHWLSQPSQALLACGYLLCWWPAGYFINWLTQPWQRELQSAAQGLPRAGRWIGLLERTLVFTFILIDAFSAIGFLITAKSILRFGEITDPANRKGAEYILIGTLLSFLWAIATGLLVQALR